MQLSAGQIIDRYLQPDQPTGPTVDGIIAGAPAAVVTGIVTTFLASQYVLEQAVALGANLVITHEGLYYSHHTNMDALVNNSVFLKKKAWIEDSGLVIYRYHDYIHRCLPDRITDGLVKALEWQDDVEELLPEATILQIPTVDLRELVSAVKQKLGLPYVRVIGDPSAQVSRVAVTVGYRGGGAVAIPLFENKALDVVITGEGPEWETPEYVRDAMHQGSRKALILLGHAASEEPGMQRFAMQLQAVVPDVPVHFISDRQAISIL